MRLCWLNSLFSVNIILQTSHRKSSDGVEAAAAWVRVCCLKSTFSGNVKPQISHRYWRVSSWSLCSPLGPLVFSWDLICLRKLSVLSKIPHTSQQLQLVFECTVFKCRLKLLKLVKLNPQRSQRGIVFLCWYTIKCRELFRFLLLSLFLDACSGGSKKSGGKGN